jgi:hypothetical protein
MRHPLFVAVFGLALSTVAAGSAHALTTQVVKAHIPFAFHVENAVLPAGNYVLRSLDEPSLLLIRNEKTGASALTLTYDGRLDAQRVQPRIKFDRYGNQRFLHAILVPGIAADDIPVTAAEDRVAVSVARAETAKSRVSNN